LARVQVAVTEIGNILTRSSGFLRTVCSHSAQPYRGCPFGNALCGAGCYVRHNGHVTRGRAWGSFLEVRDNAAASYRATVDRERRWARRTRGAFSIFLSSSTEPFPPQEARYDITGRLLAAMAEQPPDLLIVQTHSHQVARYRDRLLELQHRCRLRVHLSIETDRQQLPGLPPHASPIDARFCAAAQLKAAGIETVITVAPLLPIADPEGFFSRIAASADAVVIDHYIGGDGSATGSRTERTSLPSAMAAVDPDSLGLAYRDRMVRIAERHLPGRVGVNIDGFAARYLAARHL
jgi:DNA repair photolyase